MHGVKRNHTLQADINITPLVDIVLVLLIIFIVLTPVASGLATLPKARHTRRSEGKSLTLVLSLDQGHPRIGLEGPGEPVHPFRAEGLERLAGSVARALDRGDALHVKADRAVTFEQLDTLLGWLRCAGADSAGLVVDSTPETLPIG